jgi:hypothetical protein
MFREMRVPPVHLGFLAHLELLTLPLRVLRPAEIDLRHHTDLLPNAGIRLDIPTFV